MKNPAPSADEIVRTRRYCSIAQAAEYADCTQKTILRWIRQGHLEARRPLQAGSSRYRILTRSLRAMFDDLEPA